MSCLDFPLAFGLMRVRIRTREGSLQNNLPTKLLFTARCWNIRQCDGDANSLIINSLSKSKYTNYPRLRSSRRERRKHFARNACRMGNA